MEKILILLIKEMQTKAKMGHHFLPVQFTTLFFFVGDGQYTHIFLV